MRVQGLVREGQKFRFQAGIPEDVRAYFGGRKKYSVTIETTLEEVAEKQAEREGREFKSRVLEYRQIALNTGRITEERVAEVAAHIFGLLHQSHFDDTYMDYEQAVRSRIVEGLNEGETIVYGLPLEGPDFLRIVRQVQALVNSTDTVQTFIAERFAKRVTPLTAAEALGTFRDAADRWSKTSRLTPKTIDQYVSDAGKFSDWFELKRGPCFGAKITKRDVNAFVMSLMAEGVARATLDRKLAGLRMVYKAGQFSDENPFIRVGERMVLEGDKLKVKRFTDRQVIRLLKLETDPNSHMTMLIGAYTGMRLKEIGDLKIENIIKIGRRRVFDLDNAGRRKTEHSYRKVPIHSMLWRELGPFVKGRDPGEYILANEPRNQYDNVDALSKRVGRAIDVISPDPAHREHSFRHTVISKLAEAGVRKEYRTAIVGHAGEDVHDDYTHADLIELLFEQVEKLRYE